MKKLLLLCLSIALTLSLCACQNNTKQTDNTDTYPKTIIDQVGREVIIEKEPERIISGYYISTSLLIALGLEDSIVAVENQADKRNIYHLSAPSLLNLPGIGTVKTFDLELAMTLEPDLIILPFKLKGIAESIEQLGIPVVYVMPESEEQLNEMISLIGEVCNKEDKANELLDYISKHTNEMKEAVKNENSPKVYLGGNSSLLSTCTPLMYQNTLIENANGINAANELTDTYWAEVSYEHILTYNPDYIILASDATYTIEDVLNDKQLENVNAVKNSHVYQIPNDIECLDSPVPSGFLGQLWLASLLHNDVYSEDNYNNTKKEYYEKFYEIKD